MPNMNDSVIVRYLDTKEGTSKEILLFIHDTIKHEFPGLECSIKWEMPHYDHNGLMCGVGVFKKHVTLFFHKGVHMKDPYGLFDGQETNKTNRGIKFTSVEEINPAFIIEYIKEAKQINDEGIKLHSEKTKEKILEIPSILTDALYENPKAKKHFDLFPYYKKKEYVEWIVSAKREDTKQNRLEKSIDMLEQGIGLSDKYRK